MTVVYADRLAARSMNRCAHRRTLWHVTPLGRPRGTVRFGVGTIFFGSNAVYGSVRRGSSDDSGRVKPDPLRNVRSDLRRLFERGDRGLGAISVARATSFGPREVSARSHHRGPPAGIALLGTRTGVFSQSERRQRLTGASAKGDNSCLAL